MSWGYSELKWFELLAVLLVTVVLDIVVANNINLDNNSKVSLCLFLLNSFTTCFTLWFLAKEGVFA